MVRHHRAAVFEALDRAEDGLAERERALEILDESLGRDHSQTGSVRVELGWALVSQGEIDRGLAEIGQGVEARERALGLDHPKLASAYRRLGAARLLAGEPDAARVELERALRVARAEEDVLAAKFDLARALWVFPQERKRALALAEEALAGQRARHSVDVTVPMAIESIAAWLEERRRER